MSRILYFAKPFNVHFLILTMTILDIYNFYFRVEEYETQRNLAICQSLALREQENLELISIP